MARFSQDIIDRTRAAYESRGGQKNITTQSLLAKYGITTKDVEAQKRPALSTATKKPGTLGFLGDKFVSGAAQGAEGTLNFGNVLGQLLGRQQEQRNAESIAAMGALFGNKDMQKQGVETAAGLSQQIYGHNKGVDLPFDFGTRKAAQTEEKHADANIGKVGRFLGDAAGAVGQLATTVPLGLPGAFMSAGGAAMKEAKQAGKDDAAALGYGALVGGIEAGTEKIFGGLGGAFGKGALDDVAKAAIERSIKSKGAQATLKALVSAGFEGAEEIVAEISQRIANEATIDTDDRDVWQTLKDAGYSGAVGAAVGGLGDIVSPKSFDKRVDTENEAQNQPSAATSQEVGADTPAARTAESSENLGAGESTIVNTDPAQHTPAEQVKVDEYQSAVNDRLAEFYQKSLKGEANAPFVFSEVSERAAQEIMDITGKDVRGFTLVMEPRIAQHINRDHGANGKSDHTMRDINDVARMQYVIENFDRAEDGGTTDAYWETKENGRNRRARTVVFEKKVNGTYYVVEAVPITKARRTYIVSAYMSKNGINNTEASRLADAVSPPAYTANTDNANTSVASTIPQDSEMRNKNVATGAAAAGELDTPFSQWRDSTDAPLHEMGEKATRYLGVPTQDRVNPDMRTMKTPQTIAEAAVTTDENAARIENAYYNGDYSYVPVVDAELAEQASAAIEDKGWNDALKDWTAAVRSGKANAQLVAEGAVLINNAGNNEAASAETYADLVLDYSTLLHNAGQALQAARILKILTPEGRLYGIQKSVQRMSEEMSKYLKKRGVEKVEIPEALFEEYRNAQDDAARDAVVKKMQQSVADQLPGTWLERWTALRYVNMLGNFKTQVRNLLGNTTMRATYALKNQVANLVEAVANKATGGKVQRTKSAFVGTDWMRAAKGDYLTVKDAIAGSGKYNDMQDAGNAFERGVQENRQIFKSGLMEGYRKATNWAMEQGDILFSKGIYARSLAGYLKAKGFNPQQLTDGSISTEVLDDARLYAIKEAQEATFRDNNAFSSWVSKLGRRSDTHPLGKIAAEGLAPFRKTPANVMVRAEEFSPLGFVNTVVTAVKAGKGQASINDVINSASKALTGSAMVGLGWLLADMGVLRGVPDEDEQAADALMNYQNYAIVLPNGATYTLDWAAPASLLLFVGAAAQDAYSDGDLSWRDIEGAITSLTEPMVQMSMLSGINDALDGIKYSDNNLLQMAGTMIASYLTQGLTNTLLGQVERISEENRMTTYTKSDSPLPDWVQRAIGKASAKTPLGDFQQTEYLDEFGNTESNGGIGERILENLFSPGYYNESNEGKPAYDFAFEMNRLLGYDAFPATYTDSEIKYEDKTYELTQEEKELWQKTRGEIAEDHLTAASNSEAFGALSDEQKRDVLQTLKTFANDQGKNEVLEEKGVKPEVSDLDKARASLRAGDFVTYYSILTATNDVLDGATAQEVSTLEKLLDMGIPAAVGKVLEKDGDFTNLLEAVNAGVSVQHYYDYTVVKSQWNASPAPGYGSAPNWQKFNAIGGMNIPQEEKLALIGGVSENFLEKAQEAVNQGVSLSDVLRYYEAITARNADGSDKNKAEKNAAAQALNLGYNLAILNGIFG